MKDITLYILFSMIEGFSILCLILSLFRLPPKEYMKEILIVNSIISISTYLFKDNFLSNVAPLLILALLFLLLVAVFKISLLYSIFIAVFGFVMCFILQGVLIYIPTLFTDLTLSEIRDNNIYGQIFQLVSSVVFLFLSKTFFVKGYGFSFVPYTLSLAFKFTPKNVVLLLSSAVGVVSIGVLFDLDNMLTGVLLLSVSFGLLLFIGIKREEVGGFD